jgi:hypothetical protein
LQVPLPRRARTVVVKLVAVAKATPSLAERLAPWREVLVLIVGGLWTFYLFVTIEYHQHQLDDRQKELANTKAEIDLQYEKMSNENAQTINRLDIGQKQHNSVYSGDRRFLAEATLDIARALRTNAYVGTLTLHVTNTSQSELELTYAIVDYYIGTLTRSEPLTLINAPDVPGGVTWQFVGTEGGFCSTKARFQSFPFAGRGRTLMAGNLGAGVLEPGGHNPVKHDFVVNLDANQILGAMVYFGLDEGQLDDNRLAIRLWRFPPPEESGTKANVGAGAP